MKVYVISYGGHDSPDDIDEFESEKEFLGEYVKWDKYTKDSIRYIIKGRELKPVEKTREIITEWKLEGV